MKVACALLLCLGLFSASHAQLDTDAIKELGKTVLDNIVAKGQDLAAEAVKNFLDGLIPGLGGLIGKRDLSRFSDAFTDLANKLGALVDEGKKLAGTTFADSIDKLKSLANKYTTLIGSIKDASGIKAHVDSVVADHHTRQKRIIDTLVQAGKQLLSQAVEKAKDAAATLKQGASALVSGLLQKSVDLLGKRGLTDHLEAIGNVLSNALGPLQEAVGGVGETLKGHFSNLVDTVQGHATALKTKLDPHMSDLQDHGQKLLDHGKNALGALSEVISDILNQTVQNAGENLSGISDTLSQVGDTVVNHFTGDDANQVTY